MCASSTVPGVNAPTSDQLLETCIDAARAGGAVLVDGLAGARRVEMKSARASIVTEIDLEEQRAVIDPPPGLIDDRAVHDDAADGHSVSARDAGKEEA